MPGREELSERQVRGVRIARGYGAVAKEVLAGGAGRLDTHAGEPEDEAPPFGVSSFQQ